MQARAAAARIVERVVRHGASLDRATAAGLDRVPAPDRGLVRELSFGTLRWLPRLQALVAQLLHRPLKARDGDVEALLLVGLYQLLETRIPPHAAVAESVTATTALGKRWAGGLVNASLRRFLRERDALLATVASDPVAETAHPAWLLERLQAAWPDDWSTVVTANNRRPPLTLRINLTRTSRDDYLARLISGGLSARPLAHAPAAVQLDVPCDVERLPGFAAGEVSVQDAAAQLAAPLLDPRPGERILDACAAPGGKTGHLIEYRPEAAALLALDSSAERLERLQQNVSRLGGSVIGIAADATRPPDWWDDEPFARILLDAPCSGSGVIRRHPDIKVLRRADDLTALAAQQSRLLAALWPLLAPGGRLLYATCSLLPEENELIIKEFLENEGAAREVDIDVAWGRPRTHGRQILPGEDGMDGFYYALLERPG